MNAKVRVNIPMTLEVEGNWDDKCQLDQIYRDAIRKAKCSMVEICKTHNVQFGTNGLIIESIVLKD